VTTFEWLTVIMTIVTLLGGACAAVIWRKINDTQSTVHDIKEEYNAEINNERARMTSLFERMAVVEYAKVSREELYQTVEVIISKMQTSLDEKFSIRDKHLDSNISRIEQSLKDLAHEIRSRS
jgi:hypothetical protein